MTTQPARPASAPTAARALGWHAAHIAATFAVTLGGMLAAAHQPATRDLVVSLLPAAAVATLRALEARSVPATKPEQHA